MKRVLVALLTGCLVFSMAGCGSGSKGDEKVELTILTRLNEESGEEKFLRESLAQYAEENGIDITVDNVPVEEDYLNKLRTSFADGQTPNIFYDYGGSRTLDYLESDALVNFETYLDEDPEWKDTFMKSCWGDVDYTDEGYEGLWGLPAKSYVVSLYCNEEIFEENNLEYPESFDDLLDVCEKLMEAGIQPFQCGAKDSYRLGHLHNNIVLKSLGADAADKLADRTLAYDSEEMIETYRVIDNMIKKGYLGKDLLDTDVNTEKSMYLAGETAMRWDGEWFIQPLKDAGDIYNKTKVVPFPYINEECKVYAQGGNNDILFASKLNKSDKEVEETVKLAKFMTSQEYMRQNNEIASYLYPIKFTPTENTPENPLLEDVKELLAGYEETRTDLQVYDKDTHMIDTVRNALQGLAMGNSPEQVGKEIVERIEQYQN